MFTFLRNSTPKASFLMALLTVCLFMSCKQEQTPIEMNTSQEQVQNRANDSVQTDTYAIDETDNWKTLLPTATTAAVIEHQYYILSYLEEFEQAEWVAYELKKENVVNRNYKRPFFIEDDKVETNSADWRNYKNTNYDKGHLCPAADMEFDYDAYTSTFLTSNISPQEKDFNAGIWNSLEQNVRLWAKEYDNVMVVTAGVLNSNLKTIGREKVAVPDYFYKIVFVRNASKPKMIAFMIPNRASDLPLEDYAVTVDAIEKITGIDFFPKLTDSLENQLESESNTLSWRFLEDKRY
ncbi:DNA/RNA non-specific endonuclease [Flavobacterium sp. GNP001]